MCALPVGVLAETMRPLPITPLPGSPRFVLGVSIIRGEPVPVIDVATLLVDADPTEPTRFVTVEVGERTAALAVDAVLGVRTLPPDEFDALPPLLEGANGDVIAAIGTLDAELLLVLRTGRLVPDSVWSALEREGPRS
jgi:purine-binding chemotaxis protein CheW